VIGQSVATEEGEEAASASQLVDNDHIKSDIEAKYAKNMKFLLAGLKRAIIEEQIHMKQKDHRKYDKFYELHYNDTRNFDISGMTSRQTPPDLKN
jgi:hypothetical protein